MEKGSTYAVEDGPRRFERVTHRDDLVGVFTVDTSLSKQTKTRKMLVLEILSRLDER
jgi:hypothetical protein